VQGGEGRPDTAVPGSPGPSAGGSWRLAFADDFSGAALDASRWVTCYDWNKDGCTNATNHELQWYTPGRVSVARGAATLTAQRAPTRGSDGRIYPWVSGMLSTGRASWTGRPRFTFTYGYLEARIKMPSVKGMFPAFWLLSADETGDPEVDVVEMIGNDDAPVMNLHWTTATGVKAQAPKKFASSDFSTDYHDFALDWEPGVITWYIDGAPRYTISNSRMVPAVPMEIIFTLAVGYPDPPPASVSSGSMSIERVRLWQH
jgi:beta-glucanase (GH16 family)